MGVRYDAIRVEVDYEPDFAAARTLRLSIPLTVDMQADPLLLAILARNTAEEAARSERSDGSGSEFPYG